MAIGRINVGGKVIEEIKTFELHPFPERSKYIKKINFSKLTTQKLTGRDWWDYEVYDGPEDSFQNYGRPATFGREGNYFLMKPKKSAIEEGYGWALAKFNPDTWEVDIRELRGTSTDRVIIPEFDGDFNKIKFSNGTSFILDESITPKQKPDFGNWISDDIIVGEKNDVFGYYDKNYNLVKEIPTHQSKYNHLYLTKDYYVVTSMKYEPAGHFYYPGLLIYGEVQSDIEVHISDIDRNDTYPRGVIRIAPKPFMYFKEQDIFVDKDGVYKLYYEPSFAYK